MTAAAPAPPPVQAPALPLRMVRGLVFFRMRSIKMPARTHKLSTGGVVEVEAHTEAGQVIARMREGGAKIGESGEPPIWNAEAWKVAGGKWSYDFGGRWFCDSTGRLKWEWT